MTPPPSSIARLAMTSLAFMFVCVPLPVCQMRSGKWSSSAPLATSPAACSIRPASASSSLPRSRLTEADAPFRIPKARINGLGIVSMPMSKWWRERCVWAPQYRSAGTSIAPMLSLSIRVLATGPARTAVAGRPREGVRTGAAGVSPRRQPRWVVVRARPGRVVEVGVRRPRPLGPVRCRRCKPEDGRHVRQQRVGVAGAALRAEMHVVELARADPLTGRGMRVAFWWEPGRELSVAQDGVAQREVHHAAWEVRRHLGRDGVPGLATDEAVSRRGRLTRHDTLPGELGEDHSLHTVPRGEDGPDESTQQCGVLDRLMQRVGPGRAVLVPAPSGHDELRPGAVDDGGHAGGPVQRRREAESEDGVDGDGRLPGRLQSSSDRKGGVVHD